MEMLKINPIKNLQLIFSLDTSMICHRNYLALRTELNFMFQTAFSVERLWSAAFDYSITLLIHLSKSFFHINVAWACQSGQRANCIVS